MNKKILAVILMTFLMSITLTSALSETEMFWFEKFFEASLRAVRYQILAEYLLENWKPKSLCGCSGGSPSIVYVEVEAPEPEHITGDANGDGKVNDVDYAIVKANYGREGCSSENNWCDYADMNKDGEVNSLDYIIISTHYTG